MTRVRPALSRPLLWASTLFALGLVGCFPCRGTDDLECTCAYMFGESPYTLFLKDVHATSIGGAGCQDNPVIPLGRQVLLLRVNWVNPQNPAETRYTLDYIKHVPGGSLTAPDCQGLPQFDDLERIYEQTVPQGQRFCVKDVVGTYPVCPEVDCDW